MDKADTLDFEAVKDTLCRQQDKIDSLKRWVISIAFLCEVLAIQMQGLEMLFSVPAFIFASHISRVSDQNGVSLLYNYHAWDTPFWSGTLDFLPEVSFVVDNKVRWMIGFLRLKQNLKHTASIVADERSHRTEKVGR